MTRSLKWRWERWMIPIVPVATVFLSIILQIDATPTFQGVDCHLDWLWIVVWSLLVPQWLPTLPLVLFGILHDILTAAPVGLSSLLYWSAAAIVSFYRKPLLQHSYAVSLGWIGLLFASMHAIEVGVWCWIWENASPVAWSSMAIQWTIAMMLYPPLRILSIFLVKRVAHDKIPVLF